jgi:hypothetical protein
MTTERRRTRSEKRHEALGLLLAAVKERSDVSAIAVVDANGLLIGGTGTARELAILGAVAVPVAAGEVNELCERLTQGTDVFAKAVPMPLGTIYLAALGSRVGRMHEAARGVERILAQVA